MSKILFNIKAIGFLLLSFTLTNVAFCQLTAVNNGWLDSDGNFIELEHLEFAPLDSNNDIKFVAKNNAFYFYNSQDSLMGPYNQLSQFNYGKAVAQNSSGWRIIDTNGLNIKKVKAHYAYAISEDRIKFQLGNKFGFLNSKGDVVIPQSFYGAKSFSESSAAVYNGTKWGFINTSGNYIIQPIYDFASSFKNGVAVVGNLVNNELQYHYINSSGKKLGSESFAFAMPITGKSGWVNKGSFRKPSLYLYNPETDINTKTKFVDAYPFHSGLATVFDGKKWLLINENLEPITDLQIDQQATFHNSFIKIQSEGKLVILNSEGQTVWQEN